MAQLAAKDKKVALAATVKVTGTDDEGLLEFYQQYFNSYPVFKDEKWELYKAMGGKRIKIGPLLKAAFSLRNRLSKNGVHDSAKFWTRSLPANYNQGGWMTGGLLVFDKSGELVYVLEEDPGKPLDMDLLEAVVHDARRRNKEKKHSSATSTSTQATPTLLAELTPTSVEAQLTGDEIEGEVVYV